LKNFLLNALLLLASLALIAIALAPILRGLFGWPRKYSHFKQFYRN
jgi:hypothetical protein